MRIFIRDFKIRHFKYNSTKREGLKEEEAVGLYRDRRGQ